MAQAAEAEDMLGMAGVSSCWTMYSESSAVIP